MNGQVRANIWPGLKVRVVEKQNQRTGQLTEGIVQKLLTSSPTHPHGIKVMLVGGVGRPREGNSSLTSCLIAIDGIMVTR